MFKFSTKISNNFRLFHIFLSDAKGGFSSQHFSLFGIDVDFFFLPLPQIDFSARDFSFLGCRAENET